ncbi:MAG: rod-binding protein, partial [Sphaerotilus sulfidivorans]
MVSSPQQLAAGGASLQALRRAAAEDPKAAIREVSKQFEALFMQELMKSMRSTTMAEGLFENQATGMGRDMLDQQYAVQMSGQPGGLAAAIARQLERQAGLPAGA